MDSRRGVWSRLMLVLAVLMLGRPPCVGSICCTHAEEASQPLQDASTPKRDCCRSKVKQIEGVKPVKLCDEPVPASEAETCPCCRPAPPTSPPGAVTRTGQGQEVGEVPQIATPPSLHGAVVSPPSSFAREAVSDQVPIYLRLAHWRN